MDFEDRRKSRKKSKGAKRKTRAMLEAERRGPLTFASLLEEAAASGGQCTPHHRGSRSFNGHSNRCCTCKRSLRKVMVQMFNLAAAHAHHVCFGIAACSANSCYRHHAAKICKSAMAAPACCAACVVSVALQQDGNCSI